MISTADDRVAGAEQASRLGGTAWGTEPRPPTVPLHGLLLVAALAGALFAQGAYYRPSQWPVAVLLLGALLVAMRAQPWSRSDARLAPLAACAALAGWAVIRAAVAGDIALATGTVAMLAGVAATVLVARRTLDGDNLGAAAVALGVAVAMTGWLGVAWRISPWALVGTGGTTGETLTKSGSGDDEHGGVGVGSSAAKPQVPKRAARPQRGPRRGGRPQS